ncbi:hypothetical protein JCM1841_005179 [Sporobolomyces salmonicolor]
MSLTHTATIPILFLAPATPSPPASPPHPAPSLSPAPPSPRRIPRVPVPVPVPGLAKPIVETSAAPSTGPLLSPTLTEMLLVLEELDLYVRRRDLAAEAAATASLPFTNLTLIGIETASRWSDVTKAAGTLHPQQLEKFSPPGIETRIQAWDAMTRAKEAVVVSKVDERIDGALGQLGW